MKPYLNVRLCELQSLRDAGGSRAPAPPPGAGEERFLPPPRLLGFSNTQTNTGQINRRKADSLTCVRRPRKATDARTGGRLWFVSSEPGSRTGAADSRWSRVTPGQKKGRCLLMRYCPACRWVTWTKSRPLALPPLPPCRAAI